MRPAHNVVAAYWTALVAVKGKYAVKWTRLSSHDFADNQVRLQLLALAYNLANFLRRLALPRDVDTAEID